MALEEAWSRLLAAVEAALTDGRLVLWDDAAHRVALLLTSPAAFEAEHFTQVNDRQAMGDPCGGRINI